MTERGKKCDCTSTQVPDTGLQRRGHKKEEWTTSCRRVRGDEPPCRDTGQALPALHSPAFCEGADLTVMDQHTAVKSVPSPRIRCQNLVPVFSTADLPPQHDQQQVPAHAVQKSSWRPNNNAPYPWHPHLLLGKKQLKEKIPLQEDFLEMRTVSQWDPTLSTPQLLWERHRRHGQPEGRLWTPRQLHEITPTLCANYLTTRDLVVSAAKILTA